MGGAEPAAFNHRYSDEKTDDRNRRLFSTQKPTTKKPRHC
jgi:hypothetical protein